jgi:hypothetical protein
MGYMYYYNNVREHSALNYQPPFQVLKHRLPGIHDSIRYTTPVLLDNAAVSIGPWSGYNVLAQNPKTLFGVAQTGNLAQHGDTLFNGW